MNSRRSMSLKLVSSRSKHIEVEIEEDESLPMAASSVGNNTVYCCIAKGRKILYSYISGEEGEGGRRELEAVANLCLDNAPQHHRWCFHTAGTRTFGFLMADGYTYFAIVDPSVGNSSILRFLERIQEGFENVPKNGFHVDTLVPIIQRLISSIGKMPHCSALLADGATPDDGTTLSSKAPLLGKSGGSRHDNKKNMKDVVVDIDPVNREARADVPTGTVAGSMSLERVSPSTAARMRRQLSGRWQWLNYVKIIIAANFILLLLLFGIWLGICKGFHCLSPN